MKGRVYTSQKCAVCGGVLRHMEGRGFMVCPNHPEMVWQLACDVRFGRDHHKRFKTVAEAERHLTYLRVQTDRGQFDQREWAKDQPLSFYSLRKKFLKHKAKQGITKRQVTHIANVLQVAGKEWDTRQIKELAEPEIEDFFDGLDTLSGKTKKNYVTVLHNFWEWVVRREQYRSNLRMPKFPDITFQMGWRNIVDMTTQAAILDEVKRLTYRDNPRIWLGIKLLSMYPKVRPGEMIKVKEGHINLDEKWIVFPDPKERVPKFIHLLPEHADLIRNVRGPRGLPDLYFFRHVTARSGVAAGVRFGQKQFRKWWNQACENLGVTGVDLYGGTKHSTVTALGQVLTPEQIQRSVTGHVSNAFRRYMLPDKNEAIQGAMAVQNIQAGGGQHLVNISGRDKKAK